MHAATAAAAAVDDADARCGRACTCISRCDADNNSSDSSNNNDDGGSRRDCGCCCFWHRLLQWKRQQAALLFAAWDVDDEGRVRVEHLCALLHALLLPPPSPSHASHTTSMQTEQQQLLLPRWRVARAYTRVTGRAWRAATASAQPRGKHNDHGTAIDNNNSSPYSTPAHAAASVTLNELYAILDEVVYDEAAASAAAAATAAATSVSRDDDDGMVTAAYSSSDACVMPRAPPLPYAAATATATPSRRRAEADKDKHSIKDGSDDECTGPSPRMRVPCATQQQQQRQRCVQHDGHRHATVSVSSSAAATMHTMADDTLATQRSPSSQHARHCRRCCCCGTSRLLRGCVAEAFDACVRAAAVAASSRQQTTCSRVDGAARRLDTDVDTLATVCRRVLGRTLHRSECVALSLLLRGCHATDAATRPPTATSAAAAALAPSTTTTTTTSAYTTDHAVTSLTLDDFVALVQTWCVCRADDVHISAMHYDDDDDDALFDDVAVVNVTPQTIHTMMAAAAAATDDNDDDAACIATTTTMPQPLCEADEFVAELQKLQADAHARQQRLDALAHERAQLQQLVQQREAACWRAQCRCAETTAALLQTRIHTAMLCEATATRQAELRQMYSREQQLRERLRACAALRVSPLSSSHDHTNNNSDNNKTTVTCHAADDDDVDDDYTLLRRIVLRALAMDGAVHSNNDDDNNNDNNNLAMTMTTTTKRDAAGLRACWLEPLVAHVAQLRVVYSRYCATQHTGAATSTAAPATTTTTTTTQADVAALPVLELLDAACRVTSCACELSTHDRALLDDAMAAVQATSTLP